MFEDEEEGYNERDEREDGRNDEADMVELDLVEQRCLLDCACGKHSTESGKRERTTYWSPLRESSYSSPYRSADWLVVVVVVGLRASTRIRP